MRQLRICPRCGSEIAVSDKFCGECGFDNHSISTEENTQKEKVSAAPVNATPHEYQKLVVSPASSWSAENQGVSTNSPNQSKQSAGNKNAVIIIITILAVVFLGGWGAYWWLSQTENPAIIASIPSSGQNSHQQTSAAGQASPAVEEEIDLSRAETYLSQPGLMCSFHVNYPDGTSGEMERISALVVPAEAVRVSEVEINMDNGEAFGYGMHYVERADGTYCIYDQTPMEISPLLKNNLMAGQTWKYQDEYGQVIWTVMDMGVTLDLGFTRLDNCLLVEEDNQAVGLKTIIYYAPGMGRVMEKSSIEGAELLKLTSFDYIDAAQAADAVKNWATNYAEINDDRTQS